MKRSDKPPTVVLPAALRSGKETCVEIHNSKQRGRILVFRKPATPDPFVNAKLRCLGKDAQGRERFFTSCLSGLAGSTSFLVTEDGDTKTYRWRNLQYVYSVAQEGPDVLWLAGDRRYIRLDLTTGKSETFGGGPPFITAGMAFDVETGKLFGGAQHELVSFSTRTHKRVRTYRGRTARSPDNFHYDSWRLSDGSYGFMLNTPAVSCLRWFPGQEKVTWQRLTEDDTHPARMHLYWLRYREGDRVYVPYFGWLDGLTGKITPHKHPPEEESCWLGSRDGTVYGAKSDYRKSCAVISAWNPATGKTKVLFTIPNTRDQGCALTSSGKLLSVDLYGVLRRYDLSGKLEMESVLKSEHAHRCNVILPAGKHRVVGTPFISMNFWDFSTKTGKGFHGGRVADSYGQCDYAVQVAGKVYFAIYGGGQLTEYDPKRPPGYPRNPRLLAWNTQGQHGAGITTDGRVVWAAFKPRYGTLDGAMVRYDIHNGKATWCIGAVNSQTVLHPMVDPASGNLIAGTTFLSDAGTTRPVRNRTCAVVLDPNSMKAVRKVPGPRGVDALAPVGPLDANHWLMQGNGRYFVFDTETYTLSGRDGPRSRTMAYAGRPGCFVIQNGKRLQLWHANKNRSETLGTLGGFVKRWWLHGSDLTCDCGNYAAVWYDAVPELRE